MANINIPESWWSDPRTLSLIELVGLDGAISGWVLAYRTSQQFWAKNQALIPKQIASKIKQSQALLSTGYLIEAEHGFYFAESEKHHNWLVERRLAGAKGGRARSRKINNLEPSKPQANSSKRKQVQASPSPSPSYSPSKEEINKKKGANEFQLKPSKAPPSDAERFENLMRPSVLSEKDVDALFRKFPLQTNFREARELIRADITDRATYDRAMIAVENYALYCKHRKIQGTACGKFKNFWNDGWERWLDPEIVGDCLNDAISHVVNERLKAADPELETLSKEFLIEKMKLLKAQYPLMSRELIEVAVDTVMNMTQDGLDKLVWKLLRLPEGKVPVIKDFIKAATADWDARQRQSLNGRYDSQMELPT